MNKKESFGTREWCHEERNCCNGCSHDCQYCYAAQMAFRFGRRSRDEWHIEEIRWKDVNRNFRKPKGIVMFPTSLKK